MQRSAWCLMIAESTYESWASVEMRWCHLSHGLYQIWSISSFTIILCTSRTWLTLRKLTFSSNLFIGKYWPLLFKKITLIVLFLSRLPKTFAKITLTVLVLAAIVCYLASCLAVMVWMTEKSKENYIKVRAILNNGLRTVFNWWWKIRMFYLQHFIKEMG